MFVSTFNSASPSVCFMSFSYHFLSRSMCLFCLRHLCMHPSDRIRDFIRYGTLVMGLLSSHLFNFLLSTLPFCYLSPPCLHTLPSSLFLYSLALGMILCSFSWLLNRGPNQTKINTRLPRGHPLIPSRDFFTDPKHNFPSITHV